MPDRTWHSVTTCGRSRTEDAVRHGITGNHPHPHRKQSTRPSRGTSALRPSPRARGADCATYGYASISTTSRLTAAHSTCGRDGRASAVLAGADPRQAGSAAPRHDGYRTGTFMISNAVSSALDDASLAAVARRRRVRSPLRRVCPGGYPGLPAAGQRPCPARLVPAREGLPRCTGLARNPGHCPSHATQHHADASRNPRRTPRRGAVS